MSFQFGHFMEPSSRVDRAEARLQGLQEGVVHWPISIAKINVGLNRRLVSTLQETSG